MVLLAAVTGLVVAAATTADPPSTLPGSAPGARHFFAQHFDHNGTYVPPHYGAPPKRSGRTGAAGHLLPPAEAKAATKP